MNKLLIICVLLLLGNTQSYAQKTLDDSLMGKVSGYNKVHPDGVLYLTTDKTLYLPTEVIWFAGYLIKSTGNADSLKADILSVTLQKENSDVALKKSYLIKNNICSGSLTLPDTISPGNYQIIACTNIINANGQPVHVFRTSVTIRYVAGAPFTTSFNFLKPANDSLLIEAQIKPAIKYAPGNRNKNRLDFHLLNKKTRSIRLNDDGTARLALSLAELRASNYMLYTNTTFDGEKQQFNLHFPSRLIDSVRLNFYPEGGDLVVGLSSQVAWEALLPTGEPVAANALLLENGLVKDTLQSDSLGQGLFVLRPRQNKIYEVKLLKENHELSSQAFKLPNALAEGVVIGMQNAIADDTLSINIQTSKNITLRLGLTSEFQKASTISVPIPVDRYRKMKLSLADIYKGINTLTILNDQGRPIAERLFFAHYNDRNQVTITPDKQTFTVGEKINAEVAVTDAKGKPVEGIFTFACVRQSRLVSDYKQNIETYHYLGNWLTNGYNKVGDNLYNNKAQLEKRLLINGWRRYTWQQLMEISEQFNNNMLPRKLSLQGRVQYHNSNSKITVPMSVMTRQDSSYNFFLTDAHGIFFPKTEELAIKENKAPIRFQAFDNSKKKDETYYSVTLTDPMRDVVVAAGDALFNTSSNVESQSSAQQQLKGERSAIQLKTVEINAKNRYAVEGYGANECGDYVCRFDYLNCPIHVFEKGNHPPVKGKEYYYEWPRQKYFLPKMVYQGCQTDNIPGIYTAREFYAANQMKTSDDDTYLSTLYWQPFSAISDIQKNAFQFFASALDGMYKITVEGITRNGGSFFGEKEIVIKDK